MKITKQDEKYRINSCGFCLHLQDRDRSVGGSLMKSPQGFVSLTPMTQCSAVPSLIKMSAKTLPRKDHRNFGILICRRSTRKFLKLMLCGFPAPNKLISSLILADI